MQTIEFHFFHHSEQFSQLQSRLCTIVCIKRRRIVQEKRENVNDGEILEDNGGILPEKADKFPIFSVLQFEPRRYMLKAKL
ncbi:MAG: hypothetical protein BLM47_12290 [Candidatus Reconcilbacillus cellulovorans]|uniref:Uncharacterized protein n=1 Tax=Candidatus Reconcilbacillus cellulovorans TaxID=1906605 RepID=A0A2A6DXT1_9BACL|nr:MAG: hypothetical protein BLM47_12290 [Candidatus Reconcilbacillus cellulovorans]